ncbi:unknown [Clostridium sp. CAG:448]|nr:unknown [Clostridium sp. CAG:448]
MQYGRHGQFHYAVCQKFVHILIVVRVGRRLHIDLHLRLTFRCRARAGLLFGMLSVFSVLFALNSRRRWCGRRVTCRKVAKNKGHICGTRVVFSDNKLFRFGGQLPVDGFQRVSASVLTDVADLQLIICNRRFDCACRGIRNRFRGLRVDLQSAGHHRYGLHVIHINTDTEQAEKVIDIEASDTDFIRSPESECHCIFHPVLCKRRNCHINGSLRAPHTVGLRQTDLRLHKGIRKYKMVVDTKLIRTRLSFFHCTGIRNHMDRQRTLCRQYIKKKNQRHKKQEQKTDIRSDIGKCLRKDQRGNQKNHIQGKPFGNTHRSLFFLIHNAPVAPPFFPAGTNCPDQRIAE